MGGIIGEDGGRLWKKKLRNDPSLISEMLKPFKKDIEGIVVSPPTCYMIIISHGFILSS